MKTPTKVPKPVRAWAILHKHGGRLRPHIDSSPQIHEGPVRDVCKPHGCEMIRVVISDPRHHLTVSKAAVSVMKQQADDPKLHPDYRRGVGWTLSVLGLLPKPAKQKGRK